MFIDSAQNTLKMAEDEHQGFIVNARWQQSIELLNHRYMVVPDEAYAEVAELWSEEAKVDLLPAQAEQILSLYIRERTALVLAGSIDTMMRAEMLGVLTHFFLGCSWPTYVDHVKLDRFIALLQHQVKQAGF
jgi:hypothetical protein